MFLVFDAQFVSFLALQSGIHVAGFVAVGPLRIQGSQPSSPPHPVYFRHMAQTGMCCLSQDGGGPT